MSEFAPPGFPEKSAVAGAQADLTRRTLESALDDFRRWFLVEVSANGTTLPPATSTPQIDLATMLTHYVALRQEVNLQTRSVRAQQEQNADLLRQFGQAMEMLSQQRSERVSQTDDKLRPLVTSLIELHDALSLASREIERTKDHLLPLLDELIRVEDIEDEPLAPPTPVAVRSFWSRWFGSALPPPPVTVRPPRKRPPNEVVVRIRSALSALITGYGMSVERLERTFAKHGLEPIATVGELFDPERMEALEPVTNSGRPNGEVVDEIRRGYLWNGRVLRFALVRVARDAPLS
jgi:molecular chaperone GrpE